MSAIERLDDHLEDQHAQLRGQIRDDGWEIDGDDAADWCMRKLRRLKAKHDEISDAAARRIAEIEAWRDREHGRLQPDIDFFEGQLKHYLRRRVEEDPDLRTIDLPAGQVKARRQSAKVSIDDNDTVTGWALRHAESAVKVVEKTLVSRLRDYVQVRRVIVQDDLPVAVEGDDGWTIMGGDDAPLEVTDGGQVVQTESGEVIEEMAVVDAPVAWVSDGEDGYWMVVPGARVEKPSLSVRVEPSMDGVG